MNTLAVVIACGREEEVAPGTDAGFLTLGNVPILVHPLKTLESTPAVEGIIIAISKKRVDTTIHLIKRYGFAKVKGIVVGGVTRTSTLKTVLAKLPETPSIIVIHEASRPFTARDVFEETIKSSKRYGCSIAAHKLPDSVKIAPKGMKVAETLERNTAWVAETPQAYKLDVLEKLINDKGAKVIDDESEYVRKPAEVHMVESGPLNIKIRGSEDLAIATALMNAKLV